MPNLKAGFFEAGMDLVSHKNTVVETNSKRFLEITMHQPKGQQVHLLASIASKKGTQSNSRPTVSFDDFTRMHKIKVKVPQNFAGNSTLSIFWGTEPYGSFDHLLDFTVKVPPKGESAAPAATKGRKSLKPGELHRGQAGKGRGASGKSISAGSNTKKGAGAGGKPWPKRSPNADNAAMDMIESLATLVGGGGKQVDASASLKGKYVGLYFSASWCGACKQCTPELSKVYTALKAEKKKFEIVFLSGDRNKKEFAKYFGTMPWLAVPFDDAMQTKMCVQHIEGNSIPRLVIVGPDGQIVNADAAWTVVEDVGGGGFPWKE
jgi:thiol-disulfide isomerase/thioredoxin